MKIDSLTIKNFKCFKAEKTFDFGRITLLTGANNSGKSSVLYSILMMLQSDDFPRELSPNGKYVSLGDFYEIVNGHKRENTIKLELKIKDVLEYIPSLELNTEWKEDKVNGLPTLTKFNAAIQYHQFDENDISDISIISDVFFESHRKNHKINFISAFRQSPRRTYLEKNKSEFNIGTEGEEYIDQIVEWDKRSNGEIKKLVETMKEMDLIEDIKINRLGGGRFEVLVKANKNKDFAALSDVGSGISAFMPIMVADLQLPNGSTLFLAEPEIHLHPSVQSKFGDYIVKQVSETEKNYVIETHSEYFLNRIRLAIVKGELKKEDIKVYFLENNGEDTDVYDINFTKTGAIKNAPRTFFDTYFVDSMDIALNAFAE